MVTSAAVTKRVDRLEVPGLVGLRLVDHVVEEHLANEERLLARLTRREREQLARLLRKLGDSLRSAEEHRAAEPPR